MTESLPIFKYHPDPVATGVIVKEELFCISCEKTRSFIYTGPVYAAGEYDNEICPWCIADGTAAEKFEATFTDGAPLVSGGLSPEVVEEVTKRTPGYESWQQEDWQVHCSDACEFHGDVSNEEMRALDGKAREFLQGELSLNESELAEFVKVYEPAGNPAVYKFICRHCKKKIYYVDYT